jgi:hypothetical protein
MIFFNRLKSRNFSIKTAITKKIKTLKQLINN